MAIITFIGFGEAASAIVQGWNCADHQIKTFDVKLSKEATQPELLQRCKRYGVAPRYTAKDAVVDADFVFSTVTADQALVAAESVLQSIGAGVYYFDLNSCAPSTKQAAAQCIEQSGAHYIDVAVMAPVHPGLNKVPLLISGAQAAQALPLLTEFPMNPKLVDGAVGAASSVKMLRSVMVKGLEALTAECTLAAVAAGVEADVFASLNKSHAGSDWDAQAAYNFERSVVHGERRAAEMREVAKTLDALNLPNNMVNATVEWQSRLGKIDLERGELDTKQGSRPIAEALLKRLLESESKE